MSKSGETLRNKILVRCQRWNWVSFSDGEDVSTNLKIPAVYGCLEYFLVDLEGDGDNAILERFCEPLFDDPVLPGDLFCLDSGIFSTPYIVDCDYTNIPPQLPYPITGEMVNRLTGMVSTPLGKSHNHQTWVRSRAGAGARARLDKVQVPRKWFEAAASVPHSFRCAVLSGTIYGLNTWNIKNPLCFNLVDNRWTESSAPPPPELCQYYVAKNIIPDPVHKRILVHLGSALYAWHPQIVSENGSSWRCVEEFFSQQLWYEGATLINFNNKSLLFFFHSDYLHLFRVWSLDDHKFMEVNWLNEFPKMELQNVASSSICYLGNNQLCLALSIYHLPKDEEYCPIFFLLFELRQSTNTNARGKRVKIAADTSDSITLAHVSTKTYRALDCKYVVDITHLGDV